MRLHSRTKLKKVVILNEQHGVNVQEVPKLNEKYYISSSKNIVGVYTLYRMAIKGWSIKKKIIKTHNNNTQVH